MADKKNKDSENTATEDTGRGPWKSPGRKASLEDRVEMLERAIEAIASGVSGNEALLAAAEVTESDAPFPGEQVDVKDFTENLENEEGRPWLAGRDAGENLAGRNQ